MQLLPEHAPLAPFAQVQAVQRDFGVDAGEIRRVLLLWQVRLV